MPAQPEKVVMNPDSALTQQFAPNFGNQLLGLVSPRNETEELVAKIWRELLGQCRIGIHDDFFRLGGHSLVATQMISRLSNACGLELPVRAIFEAPTVAGLAAVIANSRGNGPAGLSSMISRSGPGRAAELLEHLDEF